MQKISFVKMHGLGNDFVVIPEEKLPTKVDLKDFVSKISDRRCGIGCDQFITYKMIDKSKVRMSIYNQDGSKALACGNASRCLSRLLFDEKGIKQVKLSIDDRMVLCEYLGPKEFKVDMGPVSFEESWMPNCTEHWDLASRYSIEPAKMVCVDVANPHVVIFTELCEQDQMAIGKNFQNTDLFPGGVNVSFARVEGNSIFLKVWERGAGFTYACGSGAVATFAAASKLGLTDEKSEVVFKLGVLRMEKIGQNITMRGPASYVFFGDYLYE